MRGAVFLGNREVELRSFPDPTPGPGEVVIEMKASGMCGSDLKFYRPRAGRSPEGAGSRRKRRTVHRRPRALRRGGRARARRVGARGADRAARHGPPLRGLRRVHALPPRMVAALPRGHHGLRRHCARRPRRLPQGAGPHAGFAARGTEFRGRCRGGLRHRHRVRGAAPHAESPAATRWRYSARVRSAFPQRCSARRWALRVIAVETNGERIELAKTFGADAVIDASKRRRCECNPRSDPG